MDYHTIDWTSPLSLFQTLGAAYTLMFTVNGTSCKQDTFHPRKKIRYSPKRIWIHVSFCAETSLTPISSDLIQLNLSWDSI